MRLSHSQSKSVSICTRCKNGEGKTNLADREGKKGVCLDKQQRLVNIKIERVAVVCTQKLRQIIPKKFLRRAISINYKLAF